MTSPADPLKAAPFGQPQPWTQILLTVLVAGSAVYLITNHWLHILDALPYLGVVLLMGTHLFMHGGHGHAGHGGVTGRETHGGGGHAH